MNRSKIWILLVLIYACVQAVVSSCANVGSPTGGPKDTIPPLLVKVAPGQGTLEFNDNIVRLEFDEDIQVKDLQNQLIITPSIAGRYKTRVNKKTVEFLFDQPFDTNTTYTLNFREGIQDLNEGNPPKDLMLAFSTGKYLDSLSINGAVTELLTGKPVPDAVVALYRAKDTLNTFNSRPYYLSKTNKEGFFVFKNLKEGSYLISATKDLNKNLKTDPRNEPFGFLKDTIALSSSIDSLNINILSINTSPLQVNSSRPTGPYYEINLNKSVTEYTLEPLEPITDSLYSNLVDKNQKVRVYNTFSIQDSLGASFSARDSIGQIVQDTLYIRFEESKRPKENFTFSLNPSSGTIQETYKGTIEFNKPVKTLNLDSIYFQYDTLTREYLDTTQTFSWNKRRDKLTIEKVLHPEKARERQAQVLASIDSLPESAKIPPKVNGVSLYLGKMAFLSVENDSSKALQTKYTFADPVNFGSIQGKFDHEAENFTIQLLKANNFSVVKEVKNRHNFTFNLVPPGEYILRVLIDENGNGQWDPGNVHKRMEPEPVIIKKEVIKLNANWELQDINITEENVVNN